MDPFGDSMLEEAMLLAAMTRLDEAGPGAPAATPAAVPAAPPAAPAAAPPVAEVPARRRSRGGRLLAWLGGARAMPGGEPEHPCGS